MSDANLVLRHDQGSVATLTLNRPGLYNAWGPDMAAVLVRMLDEIEADQTIKVCILTGEGSKAFSSGANMQDSSSHSVESVDEHLMGMNPLSRPKFFDDLLDFRKPLICAVNGYAVGAGFLIAICCDIVLVSSSAKFSLPQTSLGIIPAYGGTVRLAQWVGRGRAMDIALTGRVVDAVEAAHIGIASRVVDDKDLAAAAYEVASKLSEMPEIAVALAKESLLVAMEEGSLRTASVNDLYRSMALAMTDESKKRHVQWRERRRARASTEQVTGLTSRADTGRPF